MPTSEPHVVDPFGDERGTLSDMPFESFWDRLLRRIKERAESKNTSHLPDNSEDESSADE